MIFISKFYIVKLKKKKIIVIFFSKIITKKTDFHKTT